MKKSKLFYKKLPLHCRQKWESFINNFPAKGSIAYTCGDYLKLAGVMGQWEPNTGPECFMPIVRKISTNGKGRPAFQLEIVAVAEAGRIRKDCPEFQKVQGFPTVPESFLDNFFDEQEGGEN